MTVRRSILAFGLIASLFAFMAVAGVAAAVDPVTVQLRVQNGSGQSGTATLTDMNNGTTRVVVDLAGSPAGPQPLHIHPGTCNSLGPVLYPLTNLANGKSETMVNAPLSAMLAAPHAVNAHKSPQEAAVYVSCGEIVAQATTPTATPRTGGGGMTNGASPLTLAAIMSLLTLVVAGATYTVRRRAA